MKTNKLTLGLAATATSLALASAGCLADDAQADCLTRAYDNGADESACMTPDYGVMGGDSKLVGAGGAPAVNPNGLHGITISIIWIGDDDDDE